MPGCGPHQAGDQGHQVQPEQQPHEHIFRNADRNHLPLPCINLVDQLQQHRLAAQQATKYSGTTTLSGITSRAPNGRANPDAHGFSVQADYPAVLLNQDECTENPALIGRLTHGFADELDRNRGHIAQNSDNFTVQFVAERMGRAESGQTHVHRRGFIC